MNNCNKCLWATRDGGCASWDCMFVDKKEAFDAYLDKLKKEQRKKRRTDGQLSYDKTER